MRENLTFIGHKEYEEAAAGIASYWKTELDKDPELRMHIITGQIDPRRVESDDYLLENILSNFTEEEREKYKSRLLVDSQQLKSADSTDKVILLDDWTVSGLQLQKVFRKLVEERPDLKECIEAHLVVASESRVEDGLEYMHTDYQEMDIPVRAYYRARSGEYGQNGAYITGAVSSADLGFENILRDMANEPRAKGISDAGLPPLTNIVRPYHSMPVGAGAKLLPEKQKWLTQE